MSHAHVQPFLKTLALCMFARFLYFDLTKLMFKFINAEMTTFFRVI